MSVIKAKVRDSMRLEIEKAIETSEKEAYNKDNKTKDCRIR
jgi:hypothetical protein